MDNYINLAELRKTAEAILVKMQDKLDEKANIDDFILEEGYDDDYNYKIKLTNDKSFIIPWEWVDTIASDAAQSQINNALSDITSFNVSIVSTLPTTGDSGTFYFLSKTGTTGDVYDEYMYINNNWEKIGTTAVDLSGYLKTTDIASWAKASTKPSYTASEVGAATSSHVHGNITTGGDITTTATIANGDRLIINDESASKLTNSSITFGTSASQYLANNGTWQAIPTTLPASDVSAWAKAATKPTYTASEVGALASNINYVTSFNGNSGVVTYTAPVTSVNGKTGAVSLTVSDIGAVAELVENSTYSTSIKHISDDHSITLTSSSQNQGSYYSSTLKMTSTSLKLTAHKDYNGTQENSIIITPDHTTINNVTTPTSDGMAANKAYVDSSVATVTSNIPPITVVELTYYDTIDGLNIYSSTQTNSAILTKIQNNEIVILTNGSAALYFHSVDRGLSDLTFSTPMETFGYSAMPYQMNGSYANYWVVSNTTPPSSSVSVTQTLTSGTKIATISGVDIYAPSYTDADGVSY